MRKQRVFISAGGDNLGQGHLPGLVAQIGALVI